MLIIINGDQSDQYLLKPADQIARKGGREVDGELAELDPSNDKSGGQVRLSEIVRDFETKNVCPTPPTTSQGVR